MSRLWDKGDPLDARVERLVVGRDPELDLRLVPWDALAGAAHATMLAEIGIVSDEELTALRAELRSIAKDARENRFRIQRSEEDGHTAIENRLTERTGDAGRKIHTGRSRNDQIIAALRLWGREQLLDVAGSMLRLVGTLSELAHRYRETSLPGYTHTRQAMPSTLGFLFHAHAESLLDDLPWVQTAYRHLDRSPLGSASGYGVALPLDRERVGEILGFSELQENALAVQNDRGKTEFLVLGAAATVATDLARMAADLILFSSDELGFIGLDRSVTTGSSIMPQKRNPDVLELVRAGAARLRARQAETGAIYGSLTSGYHRDLQLTKEPFVEGLTSLGDMLAAVDPVLRTLSVDVERCRDAVEAATAATDAVYERVQRGEPFRDAYREVGKDLAAAYDGPPSESWRRRSHPGAPATVARDRLDARARVPSAWLEQETDRVRRVWRWFEGESPA